MQEEVRHWFEQAVAIPTENRAAFVAEHCPDDRVRSEVLSLIRYDAGEPGTAPDAVREAMESMFGGEAPATPPVHRVGPFELGRLLGSGGMGFVYEGHRVDGEVRQRVAVKFAQIAPTASPRFRESAQRRFSRERQVLASLRHPYIAGLIDAGALPGGIPYAVIEQVDGVPIDTYCDTWLPDRADRIRLVLKLCDGVQFAHGNLIVHGDIKPDNVLITSDGIPKLIDFGAASDLADGATISTMRAFTPGYASPEQCLGRAPTVAADVYGLGALLYRLLTGVVPRESATTLVADALQNMCAQSVRPPSALNPALKGDLENIVLKALHPEPSRRYGSVSEFAEDLNRFLARRPVRATPDSLTYRSSRFARRHWIPLGATFALMAALVTVAAVSLRQRQEALMHAAETRRIAGELLFQVHDEIGGVIGGTRAREKLGRIAVRYLEKLDRQRKRDPELAWELLNAYARLSQSRGGLVSSLGDSNGAGELAAKSLALGSVVENTAPDSTRLNALFRIYDDIALIFDDAGRTVQQREAIDRMLSLAPRLGPLCQAQALKQLAHYFEAVSSFEQAAEAWAQSLAVLRKARAAGSDSPEFNAEFAGVLVGAGRAQAAAGDFAAAVASLKEAIRMSERTVAADPQAARNLRHLYWTYISLGDVFGSPGRFNMGRPLEAAEHYERARAIADNLVKADPANEMAKIDLARALGREGAALAESQPRRAVALFEHSHEVAMQTSPTNHSGLDSQLAALTSSIAPLVALGEFEKAQANVVEARRLATDMKQRGAPLDERGLLKAEAIHLYAIGRPRDALDTSQRLLSMLPQETRPVLSANLATVEVLNRIRLYAAGFDPEACQSATQRLVRIWDDLATRHPRLTFVRTQSENARLLSCETARVAKARPASVPFPPISGRPNLAAADR
jgi:serine/threonine protein kinase